MVTIYQQQYINDETRQLGEDSGQTGAEPLSRHVSNKRRDILQHSVYKVIMHLPVSDTDFSFCQQLIYHFKCIASLDKITKVYNY